MNLPDPVITVVIPAHNYGRFIGQAIESVLTQSFERFELIVVNDASTDDTDSIVKRYVDHPRMRYLVNETNLGTYSSLERGFAEARGTFVASLSADDYYLPNALATLNEEYGHHPDAQLIYGKYVLVNADGSSRHMLRHPGWNPRVREARKSDLADLLRYDCYVCITAAFLRKSLFDKYHFDKDIRVTDYDFVLQLARDDVPLIFADRYLAAIREHGEQLSMGSNFVGSGIQLENQITLVERYMTPPNRAKLAGCEQDILALVIGKAGELKRYPEKAAELLPKLEKRIRAIADTLSLQSAPPASAGEAPDPLVSMVVAAEEDIGAARTALAAACGQTYQRIEPIVVNVSGQDGESVLGGASGDCNVVYVRLPGGSGLEAHEAGARIAAGERVVNLDAENPLAPDHVQTHLRELPKREGEQADGGMETERVRPLVSVIIPTYNRPNMVGRAVRGVLDQSYPHVEAIVVNDGGQSVEKLVCSMDQTGRVSYIHNTRNQGRSRARK